MLINRANSNPLDSVMPVVTKQELLQIQQNVKDVYMSSEIARYIVMLSDATRRSDIIREASARAPRLRCPIWQKQWRMPAQEIMLYERRSGSY